MGKRFVHFTKTDIFIASKHMKRYSISSVIRKMQNKTTMRYYYIPIRRSKIKRLTVPSADKNVGPLELTHCWWHNHFGKHFGTSVLIKQFPFMRFQRMRMVRHFFSGFYVNFKAIMTRFWRNEFFNGKQISETQKQRFGQNRVT